MPFQFPDPSVQTEVVHPVTGEHWHYVNGAWEVEDSDLHTYDGHHADAHHTDAFATKSLEVEVDQNEEQLQAATTMLMNLQNKVDNLEDLDIENALSALAQATQDIIDLKSKVSSLELTSFLILE